MTDGNGTQMYMPVAPAYGMGGGMGNGFFGADGWWIILLLLVCGGGWGNGFGFGGGAGGMFPWMMAGQGNTNNDVQRGFDQAAVVSGINGVHDAVTTGFGNVQTAICGLGGNIQNGFAQAEIAANSRAMADMNRAYDAQISTLQGFNSVQNQLAQCCCDNRAATADLKYTLATEACNTRTANTANTQAILDKLCQLELDGYKRQLDDANNTIGQLRTQLLVANNESSQVAQTAAILAGQNAEVDALYNRLNSCPVPSTPVYGRTPIFTCGGNGCGCGMAA